MLSAASSVSSLPRRPGRRSWWRTDRARTASLARRPWRKHRPTATRCSLARRSDSKISFGSPGVGNGLHLAAELFKSLTRTQMVHVPYRGAAPAITGLISGDVQVMFMTPPSSLPFIEGEKIRALGYTGARRFARLPDVPTMAEGGVTGMEGLASWTGMFAPAKTPAAVLARLQEEVQRALATAAVRERLTAIGVIPLGSAPAEFKPFVAAQVRQIADIVRAAGIEPQ